MKKSVLERSPMKKSVLQDWVQELPGLRHQGVLLTAIRGCDTSPKDDRGKALVRSYRCAVLNPFVGDPSKAKTFIEQVSDEELASRMNSVIESHDHLPHHYIMHLVHAAEIVGYHLGGIVGGLWLGFYLRMCKKLHVNPETKEQLDQRLLKDEHAFFADQ